VKLKTIVAIVGLAAAGSVFAAAGQGSLNAQIQDLQQQVANLQQQVNSMGSSQTTSGSTGGMGQFVQLNSGLTSQLLGNFGPVNREMAILAAKKNLQDNTLYIGGYGEFGLTWDEANSAYSSAGSSSVSKSHTDVSLDHVALDMIGNLNQWAAAYIQMGQSDVGQTGVSSDSPKFQQAYILLGNGQAPVYGFVGRKDIDFGNFSTVNMFAQPLTRELFDVNGNTAGVGYQAYGFNVAASLMNGGNNGNLNNNAAGFWGVGAPSTGIYKYGADGLYTSNSNQLNNFALNGSYGNTYNNINWSVGAGYINGLWMGNSLANGGLSATGNRVGAWDINGQVGFQGLTFLAEYVSTAQNINYTSGNGDVRAWDLGTNYAFNAGVIPNQSVVSFDYSGAKKTGTVAQGGQSDSQFVLGARNQIWPKANLWAGVEYAYDHITNGVAAGQALNNSNLRLDLTANF